MLVFHILCISEVKLLQKKNKLLFTLFCSLLIVCYSCISATSVDVYHAELTTYIDQLLVIQNRIFTLAKDIVFPDSPPSQSNIKERINRLDEHLDTITLELSSKLNVLDAHDREIRLVLNAINYMQNALFELKCIVSADNSTVKMMDLERFVNFKVYATNTINFVLNLMDTHS